MFWMRSCNGQLYVNKDMATNGVELDYNALPLYTLTIRVTDDENFFGAGTAKFTEAQLRVQVRNVNDPPVLNTAQPSSCVVQGTTYPRCFTISEDAAGNAQLTGTPASTDLDGVSRSSSSSFSWRIRLRHLRNSFALVVCTGHTPVHP